MSEYHIGIAPSSLFALSFKAISDIDYDKMYEIAEKVSADRSLIAKFDADWATAAKSINGFVAPAGFHMHIVDGKNDYHPKEDDALGQISSQKGDEKWARIEVRAGHADIACIICLWCGAKATI